ncbi:hypothetical protein [Nitratireductor sp. ZSWI3]|nr:hypothetical protein [Nitratireductor sp. ZSWI3]MCR4267748.1 hypothetical protein [Nitratireductor sp. ZSWI3]
MIVTTALKAIRDFVAEFDAMMHHARHGRPPSRQNPSRRRKS